MVEISVVVPGVIGGSSVIEGIERAAEAGVDAVEFFDWESPDLDAVRAAANEHDLDIAGVLASGETTGIDNTQPAIAHPASTDQAVKDLERSIEGAADAAAETLVVTVGQAQDTLDPHAQHAAIVEVMREVAPVAEAAGVTIVLEPLNTRVDHPGYYLASSYEGYEIVDAVDSPNVKILFDVYHQQITEGFVIQNLRNNVQHVGHMHLADVPGRHEPGTGELNYRNIFAALDDIDYDGYVGCEFSPTGDPIETVRDVVDLADRA